MEAKDLIKSTDRIVVEVSMPQIEYNEERKRSMRRGVAEKFGVPVRSVEIVFKPVTVNENGERVSVTSDVIRNVQDPAYQRLMMREYVAQKGYEGVDFDAVDEIDGRVNGMVDFCQYSKYKNYRFKTVRWSNFLSYGEDNFFDFTKLHGLVLLNSEPANQGGKTTFAIDLLRFALFGKSDKAPNLENVFNSYRPEATEVVVEACVEIDGSDYVIRRTVTRPALKKRTEKSKCKQKVEYFRTSSEGGMELIENCEGESTQQTNSIIKEAIGSVDDFNLVISATSYTLGDILRMGQTDKGRLFSRWLGLVALEEKEAAAKKMWKDSVHPNLMGNVYDKASLLADNESYREANEELSSIFDDNAVAIAECDSAIEEDRRLQALVRDQLRQVDESVKGMDVETVNAGIESNRALIARKGEEKDAALRRIKEIDAVSCDIDPVAVNAEKASLAEKSVPLVARNGEVKGEIRMLDAETQRLRGLIEQGVCPNCGQPIDSAMQNGVIEENARRREALVAEGVRNKAEIDRLAACSAECDKRLAERAAYDRMVEEKARLEVAVSALNVNIENLELKIKSSEDVIKRIRGNYENARWNSERTAEINVYEGMISTEISKRNDAVKRQAEAQARMTANDKAVKRNVEIIGKLEFEEEHVVKPWNLYLEMLGKNGIIKTVLRTALPIINNEIERIQGGLCDFKTVLELDEKNNVVITLAKDGIKMDMGVAASGFEGTMASLAIRSALANISSISKANFLCTDEILGATAACNYDNIHELYNRIVPNYDFIINITHNENVYDWHEQTITISKEDNISRVRMA